MHKERTKSGHKRNIIGVFGISLLLFGIVSLLYQYPSNVNNVYASTQSPAVDLGPLIPVGPPFESEALDSDSPGHDSPGAPGESISTAYQAPGSATPSSIWLGVVVPGPGGRAEALQDVPAEIIRGGTGPSLDISQEEEMYVVAERPGEGDIALAKCVEEDDDNCEDPVSVSTETPQIETSCFDNVDGDGDGLADAEDPDCSPCFDSGEGGPDVAAFGGMGARFQFVTALPPPEELCPFEFGDLCVDEIDNDGDGVTDQEDPDCGLEGGSGNAFFDVNCNDGIDNDGDELTDAADPGCNEAGEVACSNGIDDDGDGLTDTGGEEVPGDPGCEISEPVGIEGEGSGIFASCGDGIDNDGDGEVDGEDADCLIGVDPPAGLCSDGLDNDEDGEPDSDDSDCFGFVIDSVPGGGDEDTPETTEGDGNDTGDVEPTSFTPPPVTTPQLTFVQNGGAEECPNDPSTPRVATDASGDDVYLVWEDGCGDIRFRASHDGGETFGEILNLSNNAGNSVNPRVATSSDGQFVHVTWQDTTPGNEEIFYSRSTNGGDMFNGGSPVGSPTNLSNTPRASNDHQLLVEGSNVYVTWVDFTTGNGDIYFRKSSNNGGTFSSTVNLSRGSGLSFLSSRDPDMASEGNLVSVIWTAYPTRAATGFGEIIFRESSNNGNSFGRHVIVSKTLLTDSKEPQIDYTEESERYAAWHDRANLQRQNTARGTYNVYAAESENGITFSAPVNLSNAPNNPDKTKNTSQLEVVFDVGVWDPTKRRG